MRTKNKVLDLLDELDSKLTVLDSKAKFGELTGAKVRIATEELKEHVSSVRKFITIEHDA